MRRLLLICTLGVALSNCSDPCTGHIETTALYFAEAPNHHGQVVYANVLNKPDLGITQTLTLQDKEFGTFDHVIIIEDPQMKFKGRRTVCFDEFVLHKVPADTDLREVTIPRVAITK